MYAGQFANFSGPLTTFGVGAGVGATDAGTEASADGAPPVAAGVDGLTDDPVFVPVHAARNAAMPVRAVPCRNRRRLRSVGSGRGVSVMGSPRLDPSDAQAGVASTGSPEPVGTGRS